MQHYEYRRLDHTTERMIQFVSAGDVESFQTIWHCLTVHDQRLIAAAVLAEIAELRRKLGNASGDTYALRLAEWRRRA